MIPAGFFFFGILLDNNAPLDILLLGTRFTQLTKCFTSTNFVVKSCPSSPKSLSSEPLLIPGIRITLTPHSSKATLSTSKCIQFFFVLYFSLYRSSALGISMATYRVAISLIFESHSTMRYWCVWYRKSLYFISKRCSSSHVAHQNTSRHKSIVVESNA